MLSYALKRIARSWKLFAALILGMTLATVFFGGINIGADTIGKQTIDEQLASSPVDFQLSKQYPQPIFSSDEALALQSRIRQVDGVLAAEARGTATDGKNYTSPQIEGIEDNSILYNHFLPKTLRPGQGEALAIQGGNLRIGQTLNYTLTGTTSQTYSLTLRITGLVTMDEFASNSFGGPTRIFSGDGISGFPRFGPNYFIIVSWDKTFPPILDWSRNTGTAFSVNARIDVYVDRQRLINPWDLEGSARTVSGIYDVVSNIAAQQGFQASDLVSTRLASLGQIMIFLRIPFIIFSIPVFFIAWYVGRTVSQASFNLRRREIGLLMTKGFSRVQLYRHFLSEAVLVGLVSGLAGLALAVALNPYFVSILGGGYQSGLFLSRETAISTLIFAMLLTFLSIRSPASQAAGMDPAMAMREYVYLEDTQSKKRRGAVIAFSLGLYKIILLLLGVNFLTIGRSSFGFGFFTGLVFFLLGILDLGLTFIGPFLFLYGTIQLSTGLSLRFHRRFSRISQRLIGDVAYLASKSVFRNPRRATTTVFLVALIAGYSIWVIGDLASMEDFNARQSLTRTGAEIRVSNLSSPTNATNTLRGWPNITMATPEIEGRFQLPSQGSIRILAIEPATWRSVAYYENGWFSQNPDSLFETMKVDNQTVILEQGVASHYGIKIGEKLTIPTTTGSFPPGTTDLRVIGFFGPDYSNLQPTFPTGFSYFQAIGWSYVPLGFANSYPSLFSSSFGSILVRPAPGVSVASLAESLVLAFPYSSVQTASTGSTTGANSSPTTSIFDGILNVLRLGTVFAGAAASIGVGTVAYTGFKERERETTMIAVRGLSYKQLLGLLVTEMLPLVIFALILAIVVGLVTVRGDTLALNSLSSQDFYTLLSPRRLVLLPWAEVTLATIIGLLFLGVFVPAIMFARKDLSKISRTVRFA